MDPLAMLRWRLAQLGTQNGPRTEFSSYGPIDSLLNLHYNLNRGWMVKPQAILQDYIHSPGQPAETASYNRRVRRNDPGQHPDFIVCRFGQNRSDDIMELVIEVKVVDDTAHFARGEIELSDYMRRLSKGLRSNRGRGTMIGILICGHMAYFYNLQPGTRMPQMHPDHHPMNIAQPGFHNFLALRASH